MTSRAWATSVTARPGNVTERPRGVEPVERIGEGDGDRERGAPRVAVECAEEQEERNRRERTEHRPPDRDARASAYVEGAGDGVTARTAAVDSFAIPMNSG